MHTYRKLESGGWQAGYQHPNAAGSPFTPFTPLGPICDFEWEAAAIASFLNGGRYCPDEIAPKFAVPLDEDEDDYGLQPDRPAALDDYPQTKRK